MTSDVLHVPHLVAPGCVSVGLGAGTGNALKTLSLW
jgi:hypothetical protein